jgi:hypothetical protein
MGDGCSSTNILPLPSKNQPCYFLTKKFKKFKTSANRGCKVRKVKVRNISYLKVQVRKKPLLKLQRVQS